MAKSSGLDRLSGAHETKTELVEPQTSRRSHLRSTSIAPAKSRSCRPDQTQEPAQIYLNCNTSSVPVFLRCLGVGFALFFFQKKKRKVQRYKVSAMVKDANSHVARATVTSRRQKQKNGKGRLKHSLAGHTIDPRTHWMQRLKTNIAGHMINQTHSRGCSLLLIIMLRDRTVAFSSQAS